MYLSAKNCCKDYFLFGRWYAGFFLCCLLLTAISIEGKCAPGDRLSHYTDENGLPQNSVKGIVADEHGFIWLATEAGLVRFDGRNFMHFGQQELKLRSVRFNSFFFRNGVLYTVNDELRFIKIRNGLPYPDTSVKDNFQVADYSYTTPGNRQQYIPVRGLPSAELRCGELAASLFFRLNNDCYYEYALDSIAYYTNGRQRYKAAFKITERWNFFMIAGHLYHLEQGEISMISPRGSADVQLSGDLPQGRSRRKDMRIFWNVCVPDLILLYADHSFYVVKETKEGGLHVRKIFSDPDIVSSDIITAFYNETTGRLYLGSYSHGLFILGKAPFSVFTSPAGKNVYYGQTAYGDGGILTAQGLLYDAAGKSIAIDAISKRVPLDDYSMLTDTRRNIWIKCRDRLYEMEPGTFRQKRAWQLPVRIALLSEGDKRIWIAARGTDIYSIDLTDEAAAPQLFMSMPDSITYLKQDGDVLYTGTSGHLYKVALQHRQVQQIKSADGKYISCIFVSVDKKIWIATHGDGIFLLQKDRLISFPLDERKYLSAAHCLIEDKKGFLWISTNKGLFQIATADLLAYAGQQQRALYYQYHDKQEGFNTNEFNGDCMPCALALQNGRMSFPSLNGLVVFYPDSMKPVLPDAPLFIDKIQINKAEITQQDLQQLQQRFSQLKLHISTPYSGNPYNLHITYSLVKKGEDPDWLPVPESGDIVFNTISSGQYELRIRKLKGFGSNNFTEQLIPVRIAKAWYEAIWFYVLCILGLVLFICLFIQLRIRLIQKRNRELEGMVALKTEELERQTNIQDKIIRSISHDVQTPLQYQVLLSRSIYEGLLLQPDSVLAMPARALSDSTHRLHYMISNLLQYLKVRLNDSAAYPSKAVFLHGLVAEKVSIFEAIGLQRRTRIYNHIEPDLLVSADEQIMSVIIHNLLDNAVKITRNGRIDIDAIVSGNKCYITVKDTGPGLPVHLQQWINNISVDEETDREQQPAGGLGLMMVKEFALLLHLELKVTASATEGTCFTLIC